MSDDPNLVSAGFGSRPSGVRPARQVPFRIVVAGPFGLTPGRLVGFDDTGLDEVLSAAAPSLKLTVSDKLTGDDRPVAVDLTITSLQDFSPARLVQNVPMLAAAMSARETLAKGGSVADAQAALPGLTLDTPPPDAPAAAGADSPPPPPPSAAPPAPAAATPGAKPDDSDDPLDRLLGMVDTQIDAKTAPPAPASQEDTAAKRAVSAFIGSMGGRKPQKPSAGAGDALRALDALIAAQLAEILDDPAFKALEGAWRTLRFLLRRCDRRAQCFLHAIEAPKDTAHDSLRTVLIDQSDQQPAGLGLLLSTYVYNSGAPDVALLQQLAGIGEEIQVPVVAAIAPDFIRGVTDADLAKARDPETLFQDEAYTPWTSLRAKPVARWLGVAANRIQLRAAHDLSEDRKLPLSGVTTVGEPLEAGGGVVVAALAAESAALTGWPSDLLGPDRVVDSLPLYAGEGNVFAVASPLRADAAGSLANVGLIAVVGQANRDTARLVRAPSVRSGRADTTGDLPRAGTFDYQLAVSRLIRNVEANADLIFAESTSAAIRDAMQGFLDGLMGPGASVQVTIETDEAEEQVLAIDIRTGRDILGGVTMRLDLPI